MEKTPNEFLHYLQQKGIKDEKILAAFAKTPRTFFVPDESKEEAYEDYPLSIGKGQTTSQPSLLGIILESLALEPHHTVLEIGTGSGYLTALLASLVKKVVTIEYIPTLLEQAKERLQQLGYKNIIYVQGDGTKGYPSEAPYEKIIVSAAARKIPKALIDQLKEKGILLMPLGSPHFQILTKITKTKEGIQKAPLLECLFVPLRGEFFDGII